MIDVDNALHRPGFVGATATRLFRPGPHVTYIIFFIIIGFFVVFAPNFASLNTAGAIGRITAVVTIMAVGMTFVIVCGEIDLSVGSHVSFAAMVIAMLLYHGAPPWLAAPTVLLLGAGVGSINGLIVTKLRIPSFLVTLGMLSVLRGLALSFTGSMPVPIVNKGFIQLMAGGTLLGIPAPIWWTFTTVIVGFYLLHLSVFGRRALATGGNTIAARFSGINTDLVRIGAFALCGVTASLAGLVLAARSAAGNPILGQGLELDVIAAVIIGGTSLFGGRGYILGSVVGAIFIGILGFGLIVMGLSTSIQEVVKGLIIIGAVSLNRR
ncbi:MAG TPA: ABC transporter permease [Bauldia sp.]|nr:ABC transporter permease [Bauldia sp.]